MGEGARRGALALACALVWGCTFDTTGVPLAPADSRMDAATVDVHAPADALPDLTEEDDRSQTTPADADADSGPEDALLQETAQLDTAPPDATPPDATPPDTAPPTCDVKYGKADQYYLCDENATSCEFYLKTWGGTCSGTCSSFGGTCLGGYDNSGTCGHMGQSDCNKSLEGQICICSK